MPEDCLILIGKRLKTIRKARNLTQEQLSDCSGVSIRHIAKIEKGQINPSFEVLAALAKALDITYDAFLLDPTTEQEDTEIQELIGLYRACPKKQRHWILAAARFIINELYNENKPDE